MPRVWELVTEQSVRWPEIIKAVRGAWLDIHKIHLQDVARRGAFHSDRSKQDMWSGAAIFDFGVDGPQLADVIVLGRVEARESIGVSAYGFDADSFAGIDRDHRSGVGVISSPLDICGDGLQHLRLRAGLREKAGRERGQNKAEQSFHGVPDYQNRADGQEI